MKQLLNNDGVQIAIDKNEPRISHKVMAETLGVTAKSAMQLITDFQNDLEGFGVVRFENAKPTNKNGGRPERIAYLNEDQCYLALALARNSKKAVSAKVQLIKAFKSARELVQQRQVQYLPMYHHAHDAISNTAKRALEAGSTTAEGIYHANYERLINKILGVDSGNRSNLSPEQLIFVTHAHSIIAKVLSADIEASTAYATVKQRLYQLAEITTHSLEVAA